MVETSRSVSYASWPAISNLVRVEGYGETPEANLAEFKPEGAGQPIGKMLSNIDTELVEYNITLDFDEYETFVTWYNSTIKSGTLPFTFFNPRVKVTETYTFVEAPSFRTLTYDLLVLSMKLRKMP